MKWEYRRRRLYRSGFMNAIACSSIAYKRGIMNSYVPDCEDDREAHTQQRG
jgi:hypothetical protein